MNRVTMADGKGGYKINCYECGRLLSKKPCTVDECGKFLLSKLVEIENTFQGLEYDLNRIGALVKTDKAGRCIMLPCKNGDLVYFIRSNFNTKPEKPILARIIRIVIDKVGITFHTVTMDKGVRRNFYESSIGNSVFLEYDEAIKAMEAKNEL